MWFVMIVNNFETKFLLRMGECKTREILIFLKRVKWKFQSKLEIFLDLE